MPFALIPEVHSHRAVACVTGVWAVHLKAAFDKKVTSAERLTSES